MAKNSRLKPNPALKELQVLIGNWALKVSFPTDPPGTFFGHASFEWLEDGAFLAMHLGEMAAGPPNSASVIGRDGSTEAYPSSTSTNEAYQECTG